MLHPLFRPLTATASFPVNVGKSHLSSSMGDVGVLNLEKGLTHRLQPTGSLISLVRLRSGPTEWSNPTPNTWPRDLLSDNFPPCNSLEQGFFKSLPHLATCAKLLEIVTVSVLISKELQLYRWTQPKKETLWALWLVQALERLHHSWSEQ